LTSQNRTRANNSLYRRKKADYRDLNFNLGSGLVRAREGKVWTLYEGFYDRKIQGEKLDGLERKAEKKRGNEVDIYIKKCNGASDERGLIFGKIVPNVPESWTRRGMGTREEGKCDQHLISMRVRDSVV